MTITRSAAGNTAKQPHDEAAHEEGTGATVPHETSSDDVPQGSTPHDVAPPGSSDRDNVAGWDEMVAVGFQKIRTLVFENSQLGDSPADLERGRVIAEKIATQSRMCRDLKSLMETTAGTPQKSRPAPPPERASAPEPRPVVPHNLPKFRVGTDSLRDPEQFLLQFERVLLTSGLDVGQHWRRLFHLCLDIGDLEGVSQKVAPTADWEEVKNAFLHRFGDPDRIHKTRITFSAIRRAAGESLSEFSQRFQKQMQTAKL